MDRAQIIGCDQASERFLKEWYAENDYISAHTSGSTGAPKEIHLAKADMLHSAYATCRYFGIDKNSVLVMPLSADYIAGKMMIVRAMVSGSKLYILPPSRLLNGIDEIGCAIDLLPIVPTQIEGLLSHMHRLHCRNLIVGGAPLSLQQEQSIIQGGIKAYATYGMTETCSHVAVRQIGSSEVFEAMPGVDFTADSDGCLIINAPDYTSRKFFTKDIVQIIDPHHFIWLGRKDNVINTGGIKVIPEEVERRLRKYFFNEDFYITSRNSEKWGQEVVMVVATHGECKDFRPQIEMARSEMPHHMVPKDIIQVSQHEFTYSGKILKKSINNEK